MYVVWVIAMPHTSYGSMTVDQDLKTKGVSSAKVYWQYFAVFHHVFAIGASVYKYVWHLLTRVPAVLGNYLPTKKTVTCRGRHSLHFTTAS